MYYKNKSSNTTFPTYSYVLLCQIKKCIRYDYLLISVRIVSKRSKDVFMLLIFKVNASESGVKNHGVFLKDNNE